MSEHMKARVISHGIRGADGINRFTVRAPSGAEPTLPDRRIRDESPIKLGDVVWVTEGEHGEAWISGVERETK